MKFRPLSAICTRNFPNYPHKTYARELETVTTTSHQFSSDKSLYEKLNNQSLTKLLKKLFNSCEQSN